MQQVKVFSGFSAGALEQKINDFIVAISKSETETFMVTDIKYSTVFQEGCDPSVLNSALLIYEPLSY